MAIPFLLPTVLDEMLGKISRQTFGALLCPKEGSIRQCFFAWPGAFLELGHVKLRPRSLKGDDRPFSIDTNHRGIPRGKRLVGTNYELVTILEVHDEGPQRGPQ